MNYACIFPGQGSQSPGMLSELFDAHPEAGETFERASRVLGEDLAKLAKEGPAEELNRTVNTQPVMLAASVAVWRIWSGAGAPTPFLMCGHSLGEDSALVCAEALDFDDAVALVRRRAELMQDAVVGRDVGMAAVVGLDAAEVERLCAETVGGTGAETGADRVLEAANYNAPDQVVVAGDAAAIDDLVKRLGERFAGDKKVRCAPLPVSVPSHSSLMRPAAEQLADELKKIEIRPPKVPVLHNVDARARETADEIREALSRQLAAPVQWVDTMNEIKARGAGFCVEAGPGKVLTGLARRIDRELKCRALNAPDDFVAAREAAT